MPRNSIPAQNSGAVERTLKAVAQSVNNANSEKTATIILSQEKDDSSVTDRTVEMFHKDGKITKIEYHLNVGLKQGLLGGIYKFTYRYFPKGTKEAGENNYASEMDRYVNAGQRLQFYRHLNEHGKTPDENEIINFVEAMPEALMKCPGSKIKDMLDAATKPIREDYKNNRELKTRQQKKFLKNQRSKFFNEVQ